MLMAPLQTWTFFIYWKKYFACNVEKMGLVTFSYSITDWSICNLWLVKCTCGKPSKSFHFWWKFYEQLPVRVRPVQVLSISNIFVFPIYLSLSRTWKKQFKILWSDDMSILSYGCPKIQIQQKLESTKFECNSFNI